MSVAKPNIMKNMPTNQIGTVPGHQAQENIFILKSVIAHYEESKNSAVVQFFDISKFFDRESLVDGMNELYKSSVKGKVYHLLYNLNKETTITVRTPVGDTESASVGEGWGQGTSEGAIASANSLSKGVEDFFRESYHEIFYGNVEIKPILLQDDICRVSENSSKTQIGVSKLEALAETEILNFNEDKTRYVLFGSGKSRKKLEEDFERNPVRLYGRTMKESKFKRYLGEQVGQSLAESVSATVSKRIGRAKQCVFEIKTIVEDCRSKATGGLMTGIRICEGSVIPFLLYNSSTWMEMRKKDLQRLTDLQNFFFSTLFNVQNSPICSFYWDTTMLSMKNRILKNKLLFFFHLKSLPRDSMAARVLDQQEKFGLPGILKDIKPLLIHHKVSDVTKFTRNQWRNFINKEVSAMNKDKVIAEMKKKTKIIQGETLNENYEVKEYIYKVNVELARTRYRQRYFMLKYCKTNFLSDPSFKKEAYKCNFCSSISSQSHLYTCSRYKMQRRFRNLDDEEDAVMYLVEVMKLNNDDDDPEVDNESVDS